MLSLLSTLWLQVEVEVVLEAVQMVVVVVRVVF
jgi:hypothetical protein